MEERALGHHSCRVLCFGTCARQKPIEALYGPRQLVFEPHHRCFTQTFCVNIKDLIKYRNFSENNGQKNRLGSVGGASKMGIFGYFA
jgi:hypothetical protein